MSQAMIDKNLHKVIQLSFEMLELADHGDKFRRDTGCGIVYGTLRDTAYKIRNLAKAELKRHSPKEGDKETKSNVNSEK